MLERDTGFVTDESMMLNHLKLMLSGDYIDDSDFDSDDDDDDDDDGGLSLLACMMWVDAAVRFCWLRNQACIDKLDLGAAQSSIFGSEFFRLAQPARAENYGSTAIMHQN